MRQLSIKSSNFLGDLRVYLISNGKSEKEVEGIVQELEVHLMEAEEKGKSVDQVIGQSPGDYMAKISKEIPTKYASWFKYLILILFGGFSFSIIQNLLKGPLSYSLLVLIGYASITVFFIFVLTGGMKYLSTHDVSRRQKIWSYFMIGLLPTVLYVSMYFLNMRIKTPVVHFGVTGTVIIGVITVLFLFAISMWGRTWSLLILMGLVSLPDPLLSYIHLQETDQAFLSLLITCGGILFYLWLKIEIEKKRSKKYR